MKKLLNLMLIALLLFSCTKDESDPEDQNPGLIGTFLKENSDIVIQKTTESTIGYRDGFATKRGYHFIPLKNIKITHVGGKVARNGTYKIYIFNIDGGWSKHDSWTEVLFDSISITNTDNFKYKQVEKDITLTANKNYVICYFNPDHTYVYDAKLGTRSFPLVFDDIEIPRVYYSYERMIVTNENSIMEEGFTNGLGVLRGLVDFKYELIE
jgi:hypothetical protein